MLNLLKLVHEINSNSKVGEGKQLNLSSMMQDCYRYCTSHTLRAQSPSDDLRKLVFIKCLGQNRARKHHSSLSGDYVFDTDTSAGLTVIAHFDCSNG